jgi:TonB family protein
MDDNPAHLDELPEKPISKISLAENLNTPAKIVTLEFFIGTDGHPGQVKVLQSSGEKKLDDEAVRLIRKGPDWSCGVEQYPCKVKYSIYFRG